MNDFQEQILENYKNPQNFGKPEWEPSTLAKSQNISCGDEIEMFLLVENNLIRDIKFEGRGCSISIASASLLTQEFKNKSINYDFTINSLKKLLGIPLTTSRLVCATLPLIAIQNALSEFKSPDLKEAPKE